MSAIAAKSFLGTALPARARVARAAPAAPRALFSKKAAAPAKAAKVRGVVMGCTPGRVEGGGSAGGAVRPPSPPPPHRRRALARAARRGAPAAGRPAPPPQWACARVSRTLAGARGLAAGGLGRQRPQIWGASATRRCRSSRAPPLPSGRPPSRGRGARNARRRPAGGSEGAARRRGADRGASGRAARPPRGCLLPSAARPDPRPPARLCVAFHAPTACARRVAPQTHPFPPHPFFCSPGRAEENPQGRQGHQGDPVHGRPLVQDRQARLE